MTTNTLTCLILAAGRGTRMKTAIPKPLHQVAGMPMVKYAIAAAEALKPERIVVVIGPGMDKLADTVAPHATALQAEPKGTGHAVQAGLNGLAPKGDVLVLFGDTPLVTPATLEKLVARRKQSDSPAVVVSGMTPANNTGYGRLIIEDGQLAGIVEEKDADDAQRAIRLCNGGIMLFDGKLLPELLAGLSNQNAKGELYLTDTIAAACRKGHVCAHVEIADEDVLGVNSRSELAAVEQVMQKRLRKKAMDNGVTLIDPDTVYMCADTKFGMDIVIGPNVFFGPAVSIADNVEIRSFCHIEGGKIEDGAIIGPFARIRPNSVVGSRANIGNFVELKNTLVGEGVKAKHHSYLGDATIGKHTNIGAGTICCDYDGFTKTRTEIGTGAFIGANSALVAPVKIGNDALVGAGSVITSDVPADALALERSPQKMAPNHGMATRRRERQ